YFHNPVENFFDHDALDDSGIYFPLTIERARIRAFEVASRSPRLFEHVRVALAYSYQNAEGRGGVTGGLTDFALAEDEVFFLDHDQRHTLNVGLDVDLPGRAFLAAAVHYGSGFTDGEGPEHLPGHTLFDLSIGKSARAWSFALHAVNVTDKS